MDVKVGDVFVWPTSLGWMVGTMMIFGTFLNGATLGLFNGSPLQRGFGEFVQA
jgi:acyl-coenzyme A synthetase/AMP-(fatty) acid ligase